MEGALGLMALPATLLIILGFVIYEQKNTHVSTKPKVLLIHRMITFGA